MKTKIKQALTIFFIFITISIIASTQINASEAQGVKMSQNNKLATFAGGCFWCMEPPFEKLDGVSQVISGYAGGSEKNPKYEDVARGLTGHIESVQVHYDPAKVKYEDLLNVFWRNIDPTDSKGQFVDRGPQYRPAIFYHDAEQKQIAEKSKNDLQASGRFDQPITTEIRAYETFYAAEDYHQDYYQNNSLRYKYYRFQSGRDQFIEETWGDQKDQSSNDDKKQKRLKELTPLQLKVTQHEGTERPFDNEFWDNKEAGIYVDVVSGEPLFSSIDKFKSGTGWPSFTKPLLAENIVEKSDSRLFVKRVEVRSKNADSHLGHVFPDGPAPTGLRYCINSAALAFIPVAELEQRGYGQFLELFK